ncbi:SusC/RagA family TonB-linked outer membrane protein [Mucilaginibacter sp. L196]|uniref:SusC/RagA family TonB-linked outer membrane protein n=1 Tax=Mucilaginibacter sp. L196 TaxID=1641870 RepID=UPI001C208BB8|nr:SusC/RagA family TonB-linked outer membrane protein [Mucilaginibacter sp. L196]
MAQTTQIRGKVIDKKTNETLIGVTIKIKGTTIATTSDQAGEFKIKATKGDVLQISYVGYDLREIIADPTKEMTVSLSPKSSNLDEVVVVGYGTEKKATLTGAVEVVSAKSFADRAVSNVGLDLQGQTPGLLVTRSSPRPGNEGINFQIRGATSVNGGSPLIVVDGVPTLSSTSFLNMNSDDIESVTVLKDGMAAIYGANGANGVILVTTKKGKGKLSINYTANMRLETPGITAFSASAQQYAQLWLDANKEETTPDWWGWSTQANMQQIANGYQGIVSTLYWGDVYIGQGNRIAEMFSPRTSYQHNLSISNSTENSSYRLSLEYANNQANLATAYDGQKQYDFRFSYQTKLSDRVKFSTNISLVDAITSSPSTGLDQTLYAEDMPFFPAKNPYGEWNANYGNVGNRNAAAATADGGRNNITDPTGRIDLLATVNILKDLNFEGTASLQDEQYRMENYITPVQLYDWYGNPSTEALTNTIQSSTNPGYTTTANNYFYQYYSGLFKYNKTKGLSNFSAMAGVEAKKWQGETFSASRVNFNYLGLADINLANPTTMTNSGGKDQNGSYSYLARLNYNYGEKYLVEVLGRDDGASNFAPGYKFIQYGGASVGWVFTKEDFLKSIASVVDFGKIRASYGVTGNSSGVGSFNYLAAVNNGTVVLGSPAALQQSSTLQNNDIFSNTTTWESVSQKNIGIDLQFLNNRLTTSFDSYIKDNNHMLEHINYPSVLGGSSPLTNTGELTVKGWEAVVSWNDHIGSFNYNIAINMGNSQSLLRRLEGANTYGAGENATVNGYPLNSYFLYKTAGYFQNQAQVNAYYAKYGPGGGDMVNIPAGSTNGLRPGDVIKVDLNGNGVITSGGGNINGNTSDLQFMGNGDPHDQFGIKLGGSWKGFDFSSFFQGVGKQLILPSGYLAYPFETIYTNQPTYFTGKTWTTTNTNAQFPRLTVYQGLSQWNYANNDFTLQNNRYIRLKSLIVGYTIPQSITKKLKLEKVRVYFSGNDLWEATSIKNGYDPEMGEATNGGYPFYRTWSFGVNVGF